MFAPQTNPASPAVLMCRIPKGILRYCLTLGMFIHCPVIFSRSTDFSSPLQVLQALVLGFMSPSSRVGH